MKENDLAPKMLDGTAYYTVWQFSLLTHKSHTAIFNLLTNGNKIRKLNCVRYFGKPLIPASELTEFPFTLPGKGQERYHYSSDGIALESYVPEETSEF